MKEKYVCTALYNILSHTHKSARKLITICLLFIKLNVKDISYTVLKRLLIYFLFARDIRINWNEAFLNKYLNNYISKNTLKQFI